MNSNMYAVVCRMLLVIVSFVGVRKEMLESIITSRTLDMNKSSTRRASSYRIPLDAMQALYARDAVAKSIYKVRISSNEQ
jgi:myosin heavy subunit